MDVKIKQLSKGHFTGSAVLLSGTAYNVTCPDCGTVGSVYLAVMGTDNLLCEACDGEFMITQA